VVATVPEYESEPLGCGQSGITLFDDGGTALDDRFAGVVAEGEDWQDAALEAYEEAMRRRADPPVDPEFGHASGELEDGQNDSLDRYEATKHSCGESSDDPDDGVLEKWQVEAMERHNAASHRKAAIRRAHQRHAHLQRIKTEARRGTCDQATACAPALVGRPSGTPRPSRARSSLGRRRRPGTRRSTRSASRSAGGGDPDPSSPGERGKKYTDECLKAESPAADALARDLRGQLPA
jgi:hypothetical protein